MTKLLMIAVVALALAVGGLATYTLVDGGGQVEANVPVTCELDFDTNTEPPTGTATCTGEIIVATPVGTQTIEFELVVVFEDHPPAGPSFGDVIISCSIDTGNGPAPIPVGPCAQD
jgi:hypothetical protein